MTTYAEPKLTVELPDYSSSPLPLVSPAHITTQIPRGRRRRFAYFTTLSTLKTKSV